MLKVLHETISSTVSHKELLERIESVTEAFRRRGDRIIAIMPDPMPMRTTMWTATIFYEFDFEAHT
jgi:hypothetical protein